MNPRALIVDDELSVQKLFNTILGPEGFAVDCASDTLNAKAYLAAIPYDIIFVDLHLGDEKGTDLLQQIFTFDPHAQVVLMTAQPSIDSSIEATRFGAIDYLTKPFDTRQVIATARRAVRNKRLLEENVRYRRNLDAIFQSVSEAIILVDNDIKLLQFNSVASQFCGYCQSDISTPLVEISNSCEGSCRHVIREVLTDGNLHHLNRIECRKQDGTKRVVSLTVSPVNDEKGVLIGAVSVIRDESAVVFLEKQLHRQSGFGGIIGKNAAMQRLYTLIEALADVQTTVLINGESGVGKELVAAALHHQGARRGKAFIKVNCSALSEPLLESELFGHVRGAFTGAISNKIGRFQKADGGTIFLDEIGDISPAMQMRLLRVLQENEFEQVGDSATIKVNVRVIAATNQDLAEKVRLGTFRHDLFYRLNVVRLIIPPLRDRRDDIPLLISHFLDKFSRKFSKQIKAADQEVTGLFQIYSWPGNIRELEHVIEHASVLTTSTLLSRDVLPQDFLNAVTSPSPGTVHNVLPAAPAMSFEDALRTTGGNKAKAARLLGVSRSTIYNKLNG